MLKILLKQLLSNKVERSKQELTKIKEEIENKLVNMHYARQQLQIREDYMYTDLCSLWKKQRKHKQFIKLFA